MDTFFLDFLRSLKMTVVSGIFLLASLILMITKTSIFIDPAFISVFISGVPLLYLALKKLICNKGIAKISSPLLVSTAILASIVIGELFAAGEIAFIMAIGELLEDATVSRAKKGIGSLLSMSPKSGRLIKDGKEIITPIDRIVIGDVLRILPGELIAADGIVLNGSSAVDQSILTGESLPIDKKLGDAVFCGTINTNGAMDVRVTKTIKDSSLQKMIDLVTASESKKAPIQRIADSWASWLVPTALIVAVITFFITGSYNRAVTVLVVFCPCALALSTPTSVVAAIAQATKHGVLIKSGEALEAMGKVDVVAFDKTGTLTQGKLEISTIMSLDSNFSSQEILRYAASIETFSEHPLAKAIVMNAKKNDCVLLDVKDFKMNAGKGVEGICRLKKGKEEKVVLCGTTDFLKEKGIEVKETCLKSLVDLRKQGNASLCVSIDGKLAGVIALSDVMREESCSVVSRLHDMNTTTILLTGDNRDTAHYMAKKANIQQVQFELLPQDKVAAVESLQKKGKRVCMIGDGVNDAPALKSADVSIAMGSMGSDIAVDAAEIAFMNDNIKKLPYLKSLSNATIKTIKTNLALSMLINIAAIVLSVLGILNPVTGALVHNAGSVLVILNATLLYDRNFTRK